MNQDHTRQAIDRHDESCEGVEFRAVAVMACDDELLPLQERIEAIADDADHSERQLLYVAPALATICR